MSETKCSESDLNVLLCVGVYSYFGRHEGGDMNESVLAVSDKDAMQFLDNKYSKLNIFAGGSTPATASQCTPEARNAILNT